MRLWLKESERRPNPEPVQTNDRMPVTIGLVAWIVALAAVLLWPMVSGEALPALWLWACIAGIVLGSLGLAFVQRHGS